MSLREFAEKCKELGGKPRKSSSQLAPYDILYCEDLPSLDKMMELRKFSAKILEEEISKYPKGPFPYRLHMNCSFDQGGRKVFFSIEEGLKEDGTIEESITYERDLSSSHTLEEMNKILERDHVVGEQYLSTLESEAWRKWRRHGRRIFEDVLRNVGVRPNVSFSGAFTEFTNVVGVFTIAYRDPREFLETEDYVREILRVLDVFGERVEKDTPIRDRIVGEVAEKARNLKVERLTDRIYLIE